MVRMTSRFSLRKGPGVQRPGPCFMAYLGPEGGVKQSLTRLFASYTMSLLPSKEGGHRFSFFEN
jgi:hypothetical protein